MHRVRGVLPVLVVPVVVALTLALGPTLCGASHAGTVLVLGSGGLIGSELRTQLIADNYTVLEVRGRAHIDLRKPGSLDVFSYVSGRAQFVGRGAEFRLRTGVGIIVPLDSSSVLMRLRPFNISYVFFLACEVGGSKFIEEGDRSVQLAVLRHNVQMYENVFPWLAARNISFLFTSSYVVDQDLPYGAIKWLGEKWVDQLPHGRSVRFWNVYGSERPGHKSHVVPDWARACLTTGTAAARSDGRERRQMLHVSDAAAALRTAMRLHSQLPPVTDVSTGEWVSLRDLAQVVQQASPRPCTVSFAPQPAAPRPEVDPQSSLLHRHWQPRMSLAQGVRRVFAELASSVASVSASGAPSVVSSADAAVVAATAANAGAGAFVAEAAAAATAPAASATTEPAPTVVAVALDNTSHASV